MTLHLNAPLSQAVPMKIKIDGVAEIYAKANVLASFEGKVEGLQPFYSIPSFQTASEFRRDNVEGLPVAPNDPWTLNFFLRSSGIPRDHIMLGGWGCASDGDASAGMGRYFVNFEDGIAFWLANEDVMTKVKLEPNRWQMLTATFDGKTVTLYKDAEKIGEGERVLARDTPVTGVGIVDAWGGGNKFSGEIRNFTI